jgi:hypothetical protein
MPEPLTSEGPAQTPARPFPWFCPKCRRKEVRRVTIPYECQRIQNGQPIRVRLASFSVPQCANCAELVFDYEAEQQIKHALPQDSAIDLSTLEPFSQDFETKEATRREKAQQQQAKQGKCETAAWKLLDAVQRLDEYAGMCRLDDQLFNGKPYAAPLIEGFFEACTVMRENGLSSELDTLDEEQMVKVYGKDRDPNLARIGYQHALEALRQGIAQRGRSALEEQLKATVETIAGRHVWYMMRPVVRGLLLGDLKLFRKANEKTGHKDGCQPTHAPKTMSELAKGTMWEVWVAREAAPGTLDQFPGWSEIRHFACELFQHSSFDQNTWTRLVDWLGAEHGRHRKDDSLWKTSRREVIQLLRTALAKRQAANQGMTTHPLADLAWEFHELARSATANYYLRATVHGYLQRRRAEASKPVQADDIHSGIRLPALPLPDEWHDRQLSREEKIAILAALHDIVCVGVDKIGPGAEGDRPLNEIPDDDRPVALAWAALARNAGDLTEKHRPQVRAILGDVGAELDVKSAVSDAPKPSKPRVFFSYSHKDKKYLEAIRTALKPAVEADLLWDDTKLKAGEKWREEIQHAIASATAAVLLVSPDFLASDFIAKNELPPLLEAAEKKGLAILWVHVRHSMYKHTPIEAYQATHDAGQPLASLTKNKRERVIVKVCEEIKAAAEKPISA